MSERALIRVEHIYKQSPAAVWRALTDPELHARWFAAGDVRAEVGHRFALDMGPWGQQPCEVLAVEPERLFKYAFSQGSLDVTITWLLAPEGQGTRLTMLQEGFDLDSPVSRKAFEGMKPGWPKLLERLASALSDAA
jgi:uncharacterized protein YndB with AHSA1/START domain